MSDVLDVRVHIRNDSTSTEIGLGELSDVTLRSIANDLRLRAAECDLVATGCRDMAMSVYEIVRRREEAQKA